MPKARGDPVKPTDSRWRSNECTAGVHGPALRRTVSPMRTTVLVEPPRSGISGSVTCRTLLVPAALRVPRGRSLRLADQSVHERGRVERREVVGALAEPDQLHRNSELLLYGDDDAALGRAVQLGEHDAGHVDRLGEHARLLQAVLAGGGVEDEQRLV